MAVAFNNPPRKWDCGRGILLLKLLRVRKMKGTLLEGNIRRQLIALATPLLLGNILQQMYNTVDSLIISRFMGTEAFSAVGIAGSIMNLFIFVLTGFCTGVSVIFAQTYGSGDRSAFRRESFVSITLGAGITLFLSAFSSTRKVHSALSITVLPS